MSATTANVTRIVARHFIESDLAHPVIAWVQRVFIVCVPAALLVTTWFGHHLAPVDDAIAAISPALPSW